MAASKTIVSDCPIDAALSVIDGRWKGTILWRLTDGPMRTAELRRSIPGITERMLIRHLHDLVADGIYGPATKATLDRVHAERTGATTAEPDPKHPDDVERDAAPAADAGGISGVAIVVVIVAVAVFGLLKAFGVA